jgi:phage tail sheath protein FI
MTQYKTPGVYVEEKNSFGSSIVANATAVPVFMGYTETATHPNGEKLEKIDKGNDESVYPPILINSVLEYSQSFGGPDLTGKINVLQTNTGDNTYFFSSDISKKDDPEVPHIPGFLPPAVENYFANGGGSCYIVSLGTFDKQQTPTPATIAYIEEAFELAEQSTLIVPTDLIRFGAKDYYNWCNQWINYCEASKKQFCVLDVVMKDPKNPVLNKADAGDYREQVSSSFLKYAAGYYPYLKSLTAYAYNQDLSDITLNIDGNGAHDLMPKITYDGQAFNEEAQTTLCMTFQYKSTMNTPIVTLVKAEANEENDIVLAGNVMKVIFKDDANSEQLQKIWNDDYETEHKEKWPIVNFTDTIDATAVDVPVAVNQITNWENKPDTLDFPFDITCSSSPIDNNSKIGDIATEIVIEEPVAKNGALMINGKLLISMPPDQVPGPATTALVNDYFLVAKFSVEQLQAVTNDSFVGDKVIAATATLLADPPFYDNAKVEEVKSYLAINYINMPPSPFMAGIYSRLDNASGVWTPPANVSPSGVSGPVVNLTNTQQANFNVDATAGKSIDAIRSFTGKGTLVWGARTNDGNSMDWRYVNVVRLFISMETDISKALEAYVFKANVHNTWVEVKTMIESYLFGLYGQGAFAGTTPEGSYKVLIGVGETMTDEDVLNGYMRASIMVAPVRPAEFIVLTFSQMIGQ